MNEWLMLAVGLVLGGVVAWLVAGARVRNALEGRLREAETRATTAEATAAGLSQQLERSTKELEALREKLEAEQKARAAAEASLQAERKNLEEQRQLFEQRVTQTFKAVSGDVLGSQSESFLRLARQTFEKLRAEAEGDLGKRQEAIEGVVKPLKEILQSYEQGIQQLEASRKEAYGKLEAYLTQLGGTQKELQEETAKLVTALRKPQVRGRWGEISLRRLAELAGMVERCDFFEQPSFPSAEGLQRPDMVVHLPGDRQIIVDSKVALDAYLDALEVSSEDLRKQHLARHAAQVRRHMEQLGSKAYWDRLEKSPEFAVLFLPGDSFLSAAVEHDPTLIEDGMARRVVISTPNTLIALLLAVYHGWQQTEIAKNAQAISDLGKQLYKRVSTMWEHLDSLRSAIDKAVEAWNRLVGSLEHQVLPGVRRFRELKATTAEEIPKLEVVERTTRALPPPPADESE